MHLAQEDLKENKGLEVNCPDSRQRRSLRLKQREEEEGQQEEWQRGWRAAAKQVATANKLAASQACLLAHTRCLRGRWCGRLGASSWLPFHLASWGDPGLRCVGACSFVCVLVGAICSEQWTIWPRTILKLHMVYAKKHILYNVDVCGFLSNSTPSLCHRPTLSVGTHIWRNPGHHHTMCP